MKNNDFEDDGRSVADMSEIDAHLPRLPRKGRRRPEDDKDAPPPMSSVERRAYTFGALKAALLVAGVFVIAGFLFILFCLKVWLR